MNDFGQRFVIDTNTLSQLGRKRRASEFFLENAVIPEEVMHEAAGFPDIAALQDKKYPTTPRVLHWLSKIMESISPGDTRLVDLYANRGNADPLVVACALEGKEHNDPILFGPKWVVVTGDEAVRNKAQEFELEVISNPEFAALIDAADARS
ncbi:hypothetical protein [Devriesea agamarum]|uniref:hypothetical protein n=1 Tax=Devriesea agamarum TaxID=472569 RepID=UPI00071E5AA8|nr:hypothetical protein [Devriesea agamarum]